MRPRLAIVLLLIVLVPLGAFAWLGARISRDERQVLLEERQRLLFLRLGDIDDEVGRFIAERKRALESVTRFERIEASLIRERVRKTAFVRQIFVIGTDGALLYPSLSASLTQSEREFLRRTRQLWTQGDVFDPPAEDGAGSIRTEGWYAWYWETGLNLIYWRRDSEGRIVGAEVDRVRLLSDVIGRLPAGRGDDSVLPEASIALLDARGSPIYLWGRYEPSDGEQPRAERTLSEPLGAWKLQYFMSPTRFEQTLGGSALISTLAGLIAIGLALSGLALYFYSESAREFRGALQRVGFVNQVSHELKTPLTNIRMYAELLERDLADEERPRVRRQLGVIVAESQRLSRLIGNVLTFARQQRETLKLVVAPAVVDDVVEDVLTQFVPSLDRKRIAIERSYGAGDMVPIDRDVVAQIIANLVGNVEKYAAGGEHIGVRTERQGELIRITIEDRGPGISAHQAEAVFRPFHRLNDALTEGAAGTGIGLGLARDLARLHGGDLVLRPSDVGACFEVTVSAPSELS